MSQFQATGVSLSESLKYCKGLFPVQYAEQFDMSRMYIEKDNLSLHEALRKTDLVPDTALPPIRAGEKSGKLEHVFRSMSEFYGSFNAIVQAAKPKLMMPVMYIAIGLIMFVCFVLFLFPTMLPNDALNDPDPSMLVQLVIIGESVKEQWQVVLGVIAAIGFVLYRLLKSDEAKEVMLGWLLRMPLAGPGIYQLYIAMWSKFFSMLFEAGVPYSDCLKLTDGIVPDLVRDDLELLHRINRETNADLIKVDELIPNNWPPLFTAAFRVGFPTGKVAEMLNINSSAMMHNGQRQINTFVDISNKVGVIVVGIEVVFLLLSVLAMNLSQMQAIS